MNAPVVYLVRFWVKPGGEKKVFAWLAPYLVLFATLLFLFQIWNGRRERPLGDGIAPSRRMSVVWAYQFGVALYGGYFGAGIGIMMLAGLGLAGFTAIHRTIALRNYYAILINGVAALWFIAFGPVSWPDAVVLTAGQIVGGLVGARVARALPAATVRWVVVTVGVAMAVSLLARGV